MGAYCVRHDMVMDLRNFTDDDYEMFCEWWAGNYGEPPIKEFISKTAYIAHDEGEDLGFFSMHHMGCGVCYFGMPVVNPKADKQKRKDVIVYMIECAKIWAHKTGHEFVYISTKGDSFLKKLKDAGFEVAIDGCSHLFCKIERKEDV